MSKHWLIALRCGECESWREVRVTNAEAKGFDYTLDRHCAQIRRALDRDLIDPGDFAR